MASKILQCQLLREGTEAPKYAKPGDAGLDLKSVEDLWIHPGGRALVSTGIKLAIPSNHVGLIWDRSGLAANHGIHCLAGVIDSGFRGELKIVLYNLGHELFKVKRGMRIAQLLIQPIVSVELKKVKYLEETERGEAGFGSTETTENKPSGVEELRAELRQTTEGYKFLLESQGAKLKRAVEVLKELEFSKELRETEVEMVCPECHARPNDGKHDPNCELAALLAELEGK